MTPLQLLESERDKLTKSLRKSCEAYHNDQISFDDHEVHMMNLVPQIIEWNDAINTLKKGMM
jgi:hypothetical protein